MSLFLPCRVLLGSLSGAVNVNLFTDARFGILMNLALIRALVEEAFNRLSAYVFV